MNDSPWRRPRSLCEVVESSAAYTDFGYHLKDFLHEVADVEKRGVSLEPMLAEPPPLLSGRFAQGKICDAFAGGLADFLARTHHFPTPGWAFAPERVLAQPWFSAAFPQVRLRLLRDTPSAFKDKNIFVFESALQIA